LLARLEFGDAGLELLDLLSHRRKIARHRLQQLRRFRSERCGRRCGAAVR
jgi:hypothetical protein